MIQHMVHRVGILPLVSLLILVKGVELGLQFVQTFDT